MECAHPPCTCLEVTHDGYCSEHCQAAADDELQCNCGHDDCDGSEA